MIFVSAPYWDFDKQVIENRVSIVSKYCGHLISVGVVALSPVCFGHQVLEYCSMPNGFDYWDKFSLSLLSKCEEMHVIMIKGWRKSRGVKAEINYAKENGITIKYIKP